MSIPIIFFVFVVGFVAGAASIIVYALYAMAKESEARVLDIARSRANYDYPVDL